jgi:hypothetical protein
MTAGAVRYRRHPHDSRNPISDVGPPSPPRLLAMPFGRRFGNWPRGLRAVWCLARDQLATGMWQRDRENSIFEIPEGESKSRL